MLFSFDPNLRNIAFKIDGPRSFSLHVVALVAVFAIAGVNSFAQFRAEFPNELDEFKFYRNGRLADIKLTLSTTADVVRTFGEECLKTCELDENWKVSLLRLVKGINGCTGAGCRTKLPILPEYIGRVWEITITPKKRVSFAKIRISEKFKQLRWGPVAWDKNEYISYFDENNLSYRVLAEDSADGKHKKGDLKEIVYRVPWSEDLPFYSVSK